jgi:peptidyl-tRNA hydrolase, PTH1 family
MESVLIAGLGNPGEEYARTRHNVGFRVADALAVDLRGRWSRDGDDGLIAKARGATVDLVLFKPLTYMNLSGIPIASALRRLQIVPSNLVVVLDDLALPLGKLRIRPQGSDGGHNGLASIIRELGTADFPRLRCGIARETMPHKDRIPEFVLSPFEGEETVEAEAMIRRAAEAALTIATGGLAAAMNRFNT